MQQPDRIITFRIELLGVEPPVWRRIEVPDDYTFWELHVATIQDSMGWTDSHLHLFRVLGSATAFGIPDDDGEDPFDAQPGWEHDIDEHFSAQAPLASYEYDFGDSWMHEVRFEGFATPEPNLTYPRCTGGARRCPPEDVGGPSGYQDFLRAIKNTSHKEHEESLTWVGGAFDPEDFDPRTVRFDDPDLRWKRAFEQVEGDW